MTTALCPYCGHDFGAMPKRGRKCPACGCAISVRKPFPFTSADVGVAPVLMSTEQAAAVAAAWEARHRQQFVEANGFDYRDREQVNAKKREWFVKNTNFARLHPDVIALEIKPASRQPCEHPCVGIWSILDHPIIPPEDCPHDACLCDYKAIFRDELKGRFIAGWAEYNHKEKQYGP